MEKEKEKEKEMSFYGNYSVFHSRLRPLVLRTTIILVSKHEMKSVMRNEKETFLKRSVAHLNKARREKQSLLLMLPNFRRYGPLQNKWAMSPVEASIATSIREP